jgi:S-DNA-T family DNA segregation ATPase FtsK/SpoIIIE
LSFALPLLSSDRSTDPPLAGAAPRASWKQRLAALGGLVVWLVVAVALASHRQADPGFTTTGAGGPVLNLLGRPGAWLSDILLAALGLSAAWLPVVGLLQAVRGRAGPRAGWEQ